LLRIGLHPYDWTEKVRKIQQVTPGLDK
jgi:hypothetical protein